MTDKIDLTQHSEQELSLVINNDELLYRMRYRKNFYDILEEQYTFTLSQWHYLADELLENEIDICEENE